MDKRAAEDVEPDQGSEHLELKSRKHAGFRKSL